MPQIYSCPWCLNFTRQTYQSWVQPKPVSPKSTYFCPLPINGLGDAYFECS